MASATKCRKEQIPSSQFLKNLASTINKYYLFRQVINDIVALKKDVSQKWGLNGPWIIIGCSYTGTLATWLMKLYPDQFAGAVVSSAPIVAKVFKSNISIKLRLTFSVYTLKCDHSIIMTFPFLDGQSFLQ